MLRTACVFQRKGAGDGNALERCEVTTPHSLGELKVGAQSVLHTDSSELAVFRDLPQQQAHQGQPLGNRDSETE